MEKYNNKFKKKYGQNFLKDNNVVEKIVDIADIDKDSLVIEVGPGGAIMTKELAKRAGKVIAYEIDKELEIGLNSKLKNFDNIEIIYEDFLNVDFEKDISKYKYKKVFFVSNLPYYITTPIIMKLVNSKLYFNKIVLMVQKEVGDRLTSPPNKKTYGSLSVYLSYFYDIKNEFFVGREEFIPMPKVDSCIISFTEKETKLELNDINNFEHMLKVAFQFKRKNLNNNFKGQSIDLISKILKENNLSLLSRAEEIPLSVFVDLSNEITFK